MLDELVALALPFTCYASAVRHDQVAFARTEDAASGIDPMYPVARRVEGLLRIAPVAPRPPRAGPLPAR